jgi:hypothetical protein
MHATVIAIRSDRNDSADILVFHQHATHRIGWRAEVNNYIELAQDRGKPLAQIDRNTIKQKCRWLQSSCAPLAYAEQAPVKYIGA